MNQKRPFIIEYKYEGKEYVVAVLGTTPHDALSVFKKANKTDSDTGQTANTSDERPAYLTTANGATVYHSGLVGYELFNKKVQPSSKVIFS